MTRAEAHLLLNRARDGADVSEADITRALQATGDLPGLVDALFWEWEREIFRILSGAVRPMAWPADAGDSSQVSA